MPEIRGTTWDDFGAVVGLLDKGSRKALGVSDVEPEIVRRRWQLAGDHLARDSWVALDDGHLVGHALLERTQEIRLAARDATIGAALLAHAERRARERDFAHLALTTVDQDAPVHETVRNGGFGRDREILRMWRTLNTELPEPRWPDGVTVRTYRDDDGERVHALLDGAYAGWDPDYVARSHDDWLTFMTRHDEFDPDLWFLAEHEDRLVGCALHWRETEGSGWVKDLVVHESERGRGLGTALLQHAFRAYADRGAARVGLKVDSTNPTGAPALYERAGFVTDQRYGIWVKRL
ncbi:MAG TPA: GNAT family N-acetyltransferase [Gaiellaceae bacterium]